MYLGRMTWQEISDLDWARTVVLIPLGALEQHGPHLPLLTDTLIISELAARAEKALPHMVLVTPTLWAGVSYGHMGFPGTVFIPPQLLTGWIKSICTSVIDCGARRLVLFNAHGGNRPAAQTALIELEWEHRSIDGLRMALADYWSLGSKAISETRESPIGGIGHACELETSVLMAMGDNLVREDQIGSVQDFHDELAAPYFSSDMQGEARAWIVEVFHRLSKDAGAVGSPRYASREKGHQFLQGISDAVIQFLQDFSQWK